MLRRLREKTVTNFVPLREAVKQLPQYPPDHQLGMVVPRGGSSCAKCEYLGDDKKSCEEKHFIAWNGSPKLPASADMYCCDFFDWDDGERDRSSSGLTA